MRMIPTSYHGPIDYLVSALVIALPFLIDWQGAARWSCVVLGCIGIAYSLLTDYQWGVVKLISVPVHLGLDAVFGVVMLLIPALLDLRYGWVSATIGVLALALCGSTGNSASSDSPRVVHDTARIAVLFAVEVS